MTRIKKNILLLANALTKKILLKYITMILLLIHTQKYHNYQNYQDFLKSLKYLNKINFLDY